MASTIHTLKIPSSTQFLEDVREFVTTHASEASFPEAVVEQMKIAVDEACTNVIEHAYNNESNHSIDIAVIVNPDKLTVRIRDHGRTFDSQAYREPDLMAFAKNRKAGGFGVHIMRRLMDDVQFNTKGGLNETLLVKFREAR